MICKLPKAGNGFFKRIKYGSKGRLVSTNLISDPADIHAMAREMRQCANLNRNISKPCKPLVLSWDSKKESISIDKQRLIIARALELGGYANCPHVAYLHTDASRHHNDITLSRVGYDGKTVSDQFERVQWQKICRTLEQEFGLRTLEISGQEKIPPTTAEKAMLKKGKEVPRLVIQNAIDAICDRPTTPTLPELIEGIEKLGINVKINGSNKSGEIRGISFEYAGVPFTGRKLGTDYQIGGKSDTDLLDRVFYNPEQHQKLIFGTDFDPKLHQKTTANTTIADVFSFDKLDAAPPAVVVDPTPTQAQPAPVIDVPTYQPAPEPPPQPAAENRVEKMKMSMQDFKRKTIAQQHEKKLKTTATAQPTGRFDALKQATQTLTKSTFAERLLADEVEADLRQVWKRQVGANKELVAVATAVGAASQQCRKDMVIDRATAVDNLEAHLFKKLKEAEQKRQGAHTMPKIKEPDRGGWGDGPSI